jgi:hypothetical protein
MFQRSSSKLGRCFFFGTPELPLAPQLTLKKYEANLRVALDNHVQGSSICLHGGLCRKLVAQ